jgi:hypothetical protein
MSALPRTDGMHVGSSEFFCSVPGCVFHVRVGDRNVRGFGDWATLKDGTTVSHRWIDGELLCDLCSRTAVRRQ